MIKVKVSIPNLYDKEEIIEGCTVQVLTNSITGETSVGWWKGPADAMPSEKGENNEKLSDLRKEI